MRLTIRILGLDLLDVELTTDSDDDDDDKARDLSGGSLGSDRIEADGDRFMGFTNGRDE